MDQLVRVVNKIQDAFASLGTGFPIDLPQIAVVGEQSAGKSSVLENFVGKDFLPRGSGIVTRRPLVLQLINDSGGEYAEFLHAPGKRFVNFIDVRKEIEAETNRVTGNNKNISPSPINLRVFSPNVVNLTLIDLPGLTKVPVGDQPPDIEQQIREMILKYIAKPSCLILAVTPAVIDLANSEALRLAKEVDPNGTRTIGVITKIDLMDRGTHCMDTLCNKTYFLQRGYIGVVNRGQKDIEGNMDIRAAQEAELKFFNNHPIYKNIIDRIGSKYLQINLSQQLSHHIRDHLPTVRNELNQQLETIQREIDDNNEIFEADSGPVGRSKILMEKMYKLNKQIDSVLGYQNEIVNLEQLNAGSKINKLLNVTFPHEIAQIKPDPESMKREIRIAIQNAQGVRSMLFSAGAPFNAVIKKYIESTRGPCFRVCDLVVQEVRRMVQDEICKEFKVFPNLIVEITKFVESLIDVFHQEARQRIKFLMDVQSSYINTNHPDFLAVTGNQDTKTSSEENSFKSVSGMENILHRQGSVSLLSQGKFKKAKEYYFILKGQNLIWYSDSVRKELRDQALLVNCCFKDIEKNQKYSIILFQKNGGNLTRKHRILELYFSNTEEWDGWKAAFVSAGVELDNVGQENVADVKQTELMGDATLHKQIEYVYLLVNTYHRILAKIEQDLIGKICVHCIILKIREVMFTRLVTHMFSLGPLEKFMVESPEASKRRKYLLNLQRTCKEAMGIINQFINQQETSSESLPQIVMNSTYSPTGSYDKPYVDSRPTLDSSKSYSSQSLNRKEKSPSRNTTSVFYDDPKLGGSHNDLSEKSHEKPLPKRPARPPPKR